MLVVAVKDSITWEQEIACFERESSILHTEWRLSWLRIACIEWIEAEEKWPSKPTSIVSNSRLEVPKKSILDVYNM